MSLYNTEAIVLRRHLFRETSLIVSCLTQSHGRIKGLIKGIRSRANRYRTAMECITANRIVFYDAHHSQLHLIGQCELIQPWQKIQEDYESAKAAAYCVDLADTVLPLEEPQPGIFTLLRDVLQSLDQFEHDPVDVRLYFTARLLGDIGFTPQVTDCTGCGSPANEIAFWSARQGGLLCGNCRHQDPLVKPANPVLVNRLGHLTTARAPVRLPNDIRAPLSAKIDEFLAYRLDRPLRSQGIRQTD